MNINAHWIHQRLVVDTVLSFARRALPDSALSQWPDGPTPYPLAYEISDAVPSAYGDRAFHVRVALELRAVRDHGQLGGHARPTCDRVARRRVPRRRVPRARGVGGQADRKPLYVSCPSVRTRQGRPTDRGTGPESPCPLSVDDHAPRAAGPPRLVEALRDGSVTRYR